MSKLSEALQTKGIVNSYLLAGKGGYVLYWQTRSSWGASEGYYLARIGYVFKAGEKIRDGMAYFDPYETSKDPSQRVRKSLARGEAMVWAKNNGRVLGDWVKDPFGEYQPAEQLKARLEELGVDVPRTVLVATGNQELKSLSRLVGSQEVRGI